MIEVIKWSKAVSFFNDGILICFCKSRGETLKNNIRLSNRRKCTKTKNEFKKA